MTSSNLVDCITGKSAGLAPLRMRPAQDAAIGEFDIPGLPVRFSRWADRSEIAADRLGERNEEVLRELLSLTDKEIAGLYADKILVRDPLLGTS